MNLMTEKSLLNMLDRMLKVTTGYGAIYIKSSDLRIKYRKSEFMMVLTAMLSVVAEEVLGFISVLSNDDIVIVGKKVSYVAAEDAFKKLKEAISYVKPQFTKKMEEIIAVYFYKEEISALYKYVQKICATDFSKTEKKRMAVESMSNVVQQIKNLDVSEFVKRQSVACLEKNKAIKVLFQEFFVARKDLNRLLDEDFELTENKWLFAYLTQYLD